MRRRWFVAGFALGFIGLLWLIGRMMSTPLSPRGLDRRSPAPVKLAFTTGDGHEMAGDFYPDAEYSGEEWRW